MVKCKIVTMLLVCALFLLSVGCSRDNSVKESEKAAETPLMNGDKSTKDEGKDVSGSLVNVVKQQKLPDYPSVTIGAAFDGYKYFTKKEWKQTRTSNNNTYIDFIGWSNPKSLDTAMVKAGISASGCEVKFVIKPGGVLFVGMVSRLEAKADGKIYAYPLEDAKGTLDKIYANREIQF